MKKTSILRDPEVRANAALEPLIRYTKANRGSIRRLCARLEKETGRKASLNVLEKWLHKDPAKRTQPLLGAGLILMEVGERFMADDARSTRGG